MWITYCLKSGCLVQGLEKVKPYYHDLMRACSKGGFSWSCQQRLAKGDVLQAAGLPPHSVVTPRETAQSISEYEIMSLSFTLCLQACNANGHDFLAKSGEKREKGGRGH